MEAQSIDFGVYVHVPFCRERCPYCDFSFVPVETAPSRDFASAVIAEVAHAGEREPVPGFDPAPRLRGRKPISVYFGGGTPSMLEPGDVGRILEAIDRRFGLDECREITLEANPEDATRGVFRAFRMAGVNRLSLGVQSLDDRFLRALGRKHTAHDAMRSVDDARAGGIANVSIDLISSVPGMTLPEWEATLDAAVALEPSHLSCYSLTVERGTELWRNVRDGRVAPAPEDDQAAMYEATAARLGAAGFPRYEISNYAAPANRAVHNSLYWRYAEWLGVGPSAHSFLRVPGGGVRWWNSKNPFQYLKSDGAPLIGGGETVTGRAAMGEFAFTALRTADGLDERAFERVFATPFAGVFGDTVRRLESLGLARRAAERTALTDRGFLVSDSVFADLVEAA